METTGTQAARPKFDAPNILWFFGGAVATFACLDLIDNVGRGARGLWILLSSIAAIAIYTQLAARLRDKGWTIPSGVISAWAVIFVPVGGSALERLIGIWHQGPPQGPFETFEWRVLILSLLLVAAAYVEFKREQFAFALAFVAGGTLVSAEFLVPVFVSHPNPSNHATALIIFGLVFLVFAILLDLRSLRREAFWFHVVGLVALAAGLAYHAFTHSSWGWQLILVCGALILALAAPLNRATWVLFGIAGVYVPLVHYADKWFGKFDTAAALAVIGFGLFALGIAFRTEEGGWNGLQFGKTPTPPQSPPAR